MALTIVRLVQTARGNLQEISHLRMAHPSQTMVSVRTMMAVVIVAFCTPLHGQTIHGSLEERTPGSEPANAIWESTTTIGPALVCWKILDQTWEQAGHCIHVVFDAPGVLNASYRIERVYSDKVVTVPGPISDLDFVLMHRWMHDVDATMAGTDPAIGATGLSSQKENNCVGNVPRTPPEEVRIVISGIELDDGTAYGAADILQSRRRAHMAFRKTLESLDAASRQAAGVPGLPGLAKFQEYLAQEIAKDPIPKSPPVLQHLSEWIDGVRIGHPELVTTPEEFLPRLQGQIRKYLNEIDRN